MHKAHRLECKKIKTIAPIHQHPFIPYGRQWIDEEDIKAVEEVLRSDYLTQGSKVIEFEEAFAKYVGSRYAVAVNSGTAALHLACLAAGMGPGDEVLTSPITFAATANCALYVGARPTFIDIDPMTFNLDCKNLESYLAKKTSSNSSRQQSSHAEFQPRAVIPVHFAGLPCDMQAIWRIAKKFNLIVIEDACHALGAKYRGRGTLTSKKKSKENDWIRVGSCAHSDMAVFSFHPVKHITTAEGGIVTTNNDEFYQRLLLFRNHGITRDADKFEKQNTALDTGNPTTGTTPSAMSPWYYEMQGLGYNYRISDIQCALGISQLKKIDYFIRQRRFIAEKYLKLLNNIPCFCVQIEPEGYKSSYHLYVLCLDARTKIKRDQVMNILKQMGIGTQVHYIPVYRHPFYQQLGFEDQKCNKAENYFRNCFSIPMYPAMTNEDINRVMNALEEVGGML